MADFETRQQQLQELSAQATAVAPQELEDATWDVVDTILHDQSEEDARLLPAVRPLVEQLASSEALEPLSDMRLDAEILLGTWGVLSAFGQGKPVSRSIRAASCRRLSEIVGRLTDGTFDLNSLSFPVGQKMCEILALQLLQRNKEGSGVFGLPVRPSAHYFRGVDPDSQTTCFQLYAFAPGRSSVPVNVRRISTIKSEIKLHDSYKGVLPIFLGKLMLGSALSARKYAPIINLSKREGNMTAGQLWMTNQAVQILAQEAQREGPPPEQLYSHWMNHVTRQFNDLVQTFDPSVLPNVGLRIVQQGASSRKERRPLSRNASSANAMME